MNTDVKILNNVSKLNPTILKGPDAMIKWDLLQGCQDDLSSTDQSR